MNINEAKTIIESSEVFSVWKGTHANAFLAHVFLMTGDEGYQLGYYDPDSEKVSSFAINEGEVGVLPDNEILKSGNAVEPLNLDVVKISPEQALDVAQNHQLEKYPAEMPLKQFFVIQSMEGQVIFNITFFTKSFKTLNMRLSADTGEILIESLESLISGVE